MPGFFDIIFGSKPVEQEEPKPKKVKKVKTKKVKNNEPKSKQTVFVIPSYLEEE